MQIEVIEVYAPYIVIVIYAIVTMRIFARIEDLKKLETDLMKYAMEHFVTKDTYADNHKALQDQMLQIHQDVSDVKNLLIGVLNKRE